MRRSSAPLGLALALALGLPLAVTTAAGAVSATAARTAATAPTVAFHRRRPPATTGEGPGRPTRLTSRPGLKTSSPRWPAPPGRAT